MVLKKKQRFDRVTALTRSDAQQVTGRAKTRTHTFRLLIQCSATTLVCSAGPRLHDVILFSAVSPVSKTLPDT